MYEQLYEHFNSILSPKQCGFRKGCRAQHCLIAMLEKFKESRDKGDEFGAFFTDISKPFDCIDHNLLITKLSWDGVTTISLKLIFSCLSNQAQGVRINNSYSETTEKVKLSTVSHRVRRLDRYCLILISMTCFLNVRMITLVATLMTLLSIPVHKIHHL